VLQNEKGLRAGQHFGEDDSVARPENLLSCGGARFESDFVSQGFQALHRLAGQPLRLQLLQEVRDRLRVRRAPPHERRFSEQATNHALFGKAYGADQYLLVIVGAAGPRGEPAG
jgi:hypothetical protein